MFRTARRILAAFAAATGLLAATQAVAQDNYPSKTVTIIVPFSAGGATDLSARTIANLLTKQLGQTFIVENRAGASGMIGMAAVAKAAPDGYTLGWGGNSPMTVAPHLARAPLYDPRTAFRPVSVAAISSWVLMTKNALPVHDMAELVAYAKANPGKLTIGSSGNGSAPHLLGELFQSAAGIQLLHVPFKGEIEGLNAMLGGTVDMMFTATSTALPQLKANRLKGIAVTTPRRDPAVPGLPTMTEAGQPDLTIEIFFGLVGPAALPAPVVAKLAAAMKVAVADPSYKEAMEKSGIAAVSSTPEEFAALLKRHNDRWQDIIKRNKISID